MWGGALVQTVGGSSVATPVNSVQTSAFSSSVTTGNTLLVVILGEIQTTAATVTVTDSESNTYTCDILNAYNSGSGNVVSNPGTNNVPAGVSWVGVWRASNVTGGSSFKLTVTLGGSVDGFFAMTAGEVFGSLAPTSVVDTSSYNAGAGGSTRWPTR